MTGCYLITLPREFMRGIADYNPDHSGSYFLPREDVPVPTYLQRMVWPALDGWRDAHLGVLSTTEKVEENLAAGAFLELLTKLREVFL